MIAKEILDQRIVAAKPEELIKEAAIRFLGHNLGHIPVVESEHLVGLLSIETMLEDGLLEKECAYALSPTIIPQTHPNAPLSKVFGPMMDNTLPFCPWLTPTRNTWDALPRPAGCLSFKKVLPCYRKAD